MTDTTAAGQTTVQELFRSKEAAKLVAFAQRVGTQLAGADLSASQVRSVLDAVQAMHKYDANQLQLLRPKLAYAVAKKPEVAYFRNVVEQAIASTHSEDDFKFFRSLVEAIVAYHALAAARRRADNQAGPRRDRRRR